MGISGLLPVLKDITHKTHIREFAGKTAAIDGYVWLYKGAYCCPQELCEGVPTDKCASAPPPETASDWLYSKLTPSWRKL